MNFFTALLLASTAHTYVIDRSRVTTRDSQVEVKEYTYNGDTGPLHWHDLDPSKNEACASGRHQSPIDIITEEIGYAAPGTLHIDIPNTNASTFENIGAGLEVLARGSLTLKNKQYPLKQFNFHTPSEHRINGEYFPMEVHFIFQTANETAVVDFLFQLVENQPSFAPFDSIFNHCDEIAEPGTATNTGPTDFHLLSRHLEGSAIYSYTGSLTTPPCTEQVQWFVSQQTLPLSIRDYNEAKRVLKLNARYTQNKLGEENLLA
ncbi:carbonic anhydrase [Aspergillus affinis]|uniref:carbonic anhydrase n=1 Tax=Aspergillus affinis TaxID=1070780 RepID=UPI0022FE9C2C|nr:carbonic anhydrase [Aspergillus affinis]KAI9034848.1 carbonic anhydrase [Aspergillus affinis]